MPPARHNQHTISGATIALLSDRATHELIPDTSIMPYSTNTNNEKLRAAKPSPHHRRGHSRSLSNPFPSPFHFGFGKKRNHKKHNFVDSDDDDDDDGDGDDSFGFGNTYSAAGGGSPKKGSRPPQTGGGDGPMITGRCATCSSLVRYPRHSMCFRCESCFMVNDLEPVKDSAARGRDLADRATNNHPSRKGKLLTRIYIYIYIYAYKFMLTFFF